MIWIIGGVLTLATIFLVPAAPIAQHAAARRREAARARDEEDRQRREEEQRQRLAEANRIWRETPDLGVLVEYERYEHLVRKPRQQEADETERKLTTIDTAIIRHERTFPHRSQSGDGDEDRERRPGAAYQGLLLLALVCFVGVFAVGVALDYMIFWSLRPTGPVNALISVALASIAMIGVSVGSIVAIGGERHHLFPDGMTDYARQVARVAGAVLAIGLVVFVAVIAPYRSQLTWQPRITADKYQVAQDKFNLSNGPDEARTAYSTKLQDDSAKLTSDEERLSRASNVDRGSALALGVLEVFLAEGAILGGEVLVLRILLARRERARQANQEAVDQLAQADAQFIDQLTSKLAENGHDQEAIRAGLARVRELVQILGTWAAPQAIASAGTPGPGTGDAGTTEPDEPGDVPGPGETPGACAPPDENATPLSPSPDPFESTGSVIRGAEDAGARLPDSAFDATK